jgi:general secretion pathway protein C
VPADERETPGEGVILLGTSVGSKNMALLLRDGKPIILKEGELKEGILLRRVSRKEVILEVGGRRVRLELRPFRPPREERTRGREEFRISRRDLERITEDPGVMFREIRLVPYIKEGRTQGFLFEWIKPGSLFYRAGLRRGDVLISINNIAISSAEDAFRVLQVLRNEPSLRVVILRNGRRKEINVRID